jgi:A/G-specific DNA glycosylase
MVAKLLEWYSTNARDLPWRRTRNPYAIWVSEIMLQQTQVKTVIPYFQRYMSKLPTIEALAAADSETIHKLWEGLGYYTRVRNMQKAAQEIVRSTMADFQHLRDGAGAAWHWAIHRGRHLQHRFQSADANFGW